MVICSRSGTPSFSQVMSIGESPEVTVQTAEPRWPSSRFELKTIGLTTGAAEMKRKLKVLIWGYHLIITT